MRNQSFTPRQLGVALAAFIFAANRFSSYYTETLRQDAWLSVLLGLLFFAPIFLLYVALAREFPGKGLFQINEIVFGKGIGKGITVLYLFFFILINSMNQRYVADFTVNTILPEMALAPLVFSMAIVFAWVLRCGLRATMRIGWFVLLFAAGALVLSYALLAKQMQPANFMPAFRHAPVRYLQSAHTNAIISLGDMLCFLPLLRYMQPGKKVLRPVIIGILSGAALTLLCVCQNILVLGVLEPYRLYPAYDVARLIRISDAFSRMEFLFTIPALLLFTLRVLFLFFAIVEGMGQLFGIEDRRPLLLPTVGLCAALTFLVVSGSGELKAFTMGVAPFFSGFFVLLLPLLTLTVFLVRRNRVQEVIGNNAECREEVSA
ncbi:MAG: endospore germination permease [Clostridiales bacterium]|nr:endospore germination permease [Clostridiales bacterium]